MRRPLLNAFAFLSMSYSLVISSGTENVNPLNGQHLRVLGLEVYMLIF